MKTAILLMAYGSPTSMDDVYPYLQGIYHGRPVPEYAVHENTEKYRMVNAISPSNAILDSMISKLKNRMKEKTIGIFLGNKHWKPWISEVVKDISEEGYRDIIAVPLFPFPSHNVIDSYVDPLTTIVERIAPQTNLTVVNGISGRDEFIRMWADIIHKVETFNEPESLVLFTAHSLPNSLIDENDYDQAFKDAARKISEMSGITEYITAYQSRGKYGDSWLEPSIYDALKTVETARKTKIITVPIGFLYTHLEVLYDLDLEFGNSVREHGLRYVRTELPDTKDYCIELLYNVIREKIDGKDN
ncbi:MAG: ferrochelatase [Thermoplasmataceae archaeon]